MAVGGSPQGIHGGFCSFEQGKSLFGTLAVRHSDGINHGCPQLIRRKGGYIRDSDISQGFCVGTYIHSEFTEELISHSTRSNTGCGLTA